jgi:hypothetical protein
LLSWTLSVLGAMVSEQNPERALALMSEAEPLCRLVGNEQGASQALAGRAIALRGLGDLPAAMRATRDAWEFAVSIGARHSLGLAIAPAAVILAEMGDPEAAVRLVGYVDVLFHGFWGGFTEWRASLFDDARVSLGEERVDVLIREGAALSDDAAVAVARRAAADVLGEITSDEGNG